MFIRAAAIFVCLTLHATSLVIPKYSIAEVSTRKIILRRRFIRLSGSFSRVSDWLRNIIAFVCSAVDVRKTNLTTFLVQHNL
jgi:hypothetical protein